MPVALVVLAGGESRRFQRPGEPRIDKCRYPVEGKPMIERVVEAAR
ncbi:MAG: NTP transferase domain-containing protein, partial [Thermoproteus sp.]|nr:NTP transferase domain-containing protein [Thermoproteus sp.]